MKKILITGGLGFIGTNLAKRLSGHFELTILDNFSVGDANLAVVEPLARIIKGDISEASVVADACAEQDCIVHLAAMGSVIKSIQKPISGCKTNVIGTLNIIEGAVSAGVERLIFASTGGALMGDAVPPVNENSVPRPISPYGASKLACEAYLSAASVCWGLPTTVLRFGNVYGEYSLHKPGLINQIFSSLISGLPLTVYGDGRATRDFIHVSDITRAIHLALLRSPHTFNTYHISSGVETSVSALLDLSQHISGMSLTIETSDRRAGEVERNFSSFTLASDQLGFYPKVSLEEGLSKLWDWYKSQSLVTAQTQPH